MPAASARTRPVTTSFLTTPLGLRPSARNFAHLRDAVAGRANVALLPIGLSDTAGEAALLAGEDALGATTRVAVGEPRESARLERGDVLVASARAPRPDALKIDVEGHEGNVLAGLQTTLRDSHLRDIFLEVHFGILAAQGRPQAPRETEALLRDSGFEVRWADPSHLHAFRAGPCA